MMKNKKLCLILVVGFVLLMLLDITLISLVAEDGWTDFGDRFLMCGFVALLVLIPGISLVVFIAELIEKKPRSIKVFTWIRGLISAAYCFIYLPVTFVGLGGVRPGWLWISVIVFVVWLVDILIRLLKKIKTNNNKE